MSLGNGKPKVKLPKIDHTFWHTPEGKALVAELQWFTDDQIKAWCAENGQDFGHIFIPVHMGSSREAKLARSQKRVGSVDYWQTPEGRADAKRIAEEGQAELDAFCKSRNLIEREAA